ncbi:unnamed protein product [Phaedon cochleariae]|uniref:CAP N-terminal domain-containing protein n=1 Tax=Phaedon cochleariae TaxID=80249 RepID=A0A9N9SIK0_PHACE|nr:unnamed protein product [Phaedon cochleariae]
MSINIQSSKELSHVKIMNISDSLKNIYSGPFSNYLAISTSLDSLIEQQSKLVDGLFKLHINLVDITLKYKKPLLPQEEGIFMGTIMKQIEVIKKFTTENETRSEYLLCVSRFIDIFSWITQREIGDFLEILNNKLSIYKNDIMNGTPSYDRVHKKWLESWIETLEKLSDFVMNNYLNGLTWMGTEKLPVQFLLGDIASEFRNFDHLALFKEINQGENIVRILRHRSDDDGETSTSVE